MTKTIKERLIELGMEETDFDNHYSDLYVRKTDISKEFIENEYEFPMNVKTFRCNIEHDIWYDIPFGYANEDFKERYL